MILRQWHGVVDADKADEYYTILQKNGITAVQAAPGNRGVYLLKRVEGDKAHFLAFTLWDSEDAIRRFVGDNLDKPSYYPEDVHFLHEPEDKVTHYEVVYVSVDL